MNQKDIIFTLLDLLPSEEDKYYINTVEYRIMNYDKFSIRKQQAVRKEDSKANGSDLYFGIRKKGIQAEMQA